MSVFPVFCFSVVLALPVVVSITPYVVQAPIIVSTSLANQALYVLIRTDGFTIFRYSFILDA